MADAITTAGLLADELALLTFERPEEVSSALALAGRLVEALAHAQVEVASNPERWE